MEELKTRILKRERIIRRGEQIIKRLNAINSLEKRTKKPNLFKQQKEQLKKDLQELRRSM
ncbi:hypothetical protein CBU02nite_37940 [Clostridium butyricum]|uniref:Uncharacterized protein n=1 Tax=Clostridium butyricum TaxID=1492 RepID=A0A512TTM7_CLOBU|nr:hypothetical protein [Clostridium butyricum]NOW25512.1 hypothetical protein [Clostridium butyricum]GEQ23288.1 hypothetical protein CBU02nite_37940 [Clostridium butyricum]